MSTKSNAAPVRQGRRRCPPGTVKKPAGEPKVGPTVEQVNDLVRRVLAAMKRSGVPADEDVPGDVAVALIAKMSEAASPQLGPETLNYYFIVVMREATYGLAERRSKVSFPVRKLYREAWKWTKTVPVAGCGGPGETGWDAPAVDTADVALVARERVEAAGRLHRALVEELAAHPSPNQDAALRFVRGGLTPEAMAEAAHGRASAKGEKLLRRQVRRAYLRSPVAREAAGVILAT